ncbi:MAG: T9SS type A sorting domain-containing protein [Candidatus Hatepunaea meridiana]|nr:T9SS type A sorting domain-containing protein [Candidatus Hatepunaea meridiana]
MTTEKFVMLMLISFISISAYAQDAGIDRISDCLVTGYWKDIEAVDDLVFATNGYGLMIYRFDPDEGIDEPLELVRYPTPGSTGGFVIIDTLCYLTDGSSGLKILSIADVNNIYEVGAGPSGYYPSSVKVIGDYAYIAERHRFIIVSVADPSRPEIVGSVQLNMILSFEIYEDYAYLTRETDNTLNIVSMEDPEEPEIVRSIEFDHRVYDLELKSDTLFVSCGGEEDFIYVLSLSDPEQPSEITTIRREDLPWRNPTILMTYGNTMFTTGPFLGVIDIRNVFHPVYYRHLSYTVWGFMAQENYGFGCRENYGWAVIDISNYNDLEVVFDGIEYGVFYGITKQGEYLFVTDDLRRPDQRSTFGLRVVSIADNQNPVEVANVDMPSNDLNKIQIVGDYAYVYNMGFYIYDVSDPEEPELVDRLPLGRARDMSVIDDYAYIRGVDELYIMSLSNAPDVEIIGEFPPDDRIPIRGLGSTEEFVLVTSYLPGNPYKFKIYDRSDPVELELISEIDIPRAHGRIEVYEDYAYTCSADDSLVVFSISDPEHPEVVHVDGDIIGERNLRLFDSFLYVILNDGAGFYVLSLEDPTRPELIGSYDTPGYCRDLYVDDGFAYVADENNIGVYDLSRVMGFWDVRLSEDSHNFGEVLPDSSAIWQLTIGNAAQQPVDILDVSCDSAAFTFDFDDTLTLEPDEETTLEVTFTPTEQRPYTAALTIHTERRDLTVQLSGTGVELSASDDDAQLPLEFALYDAYPNPFNSVTTIQYDIRQNTNLQLFVYDLNGRLVETLYNGNIKSGSYSLTWNAGRLPSGLYLVRMKTPEGVWMTKTALVK